jgi:hypothetical protein
MTLLLAVVLLLPACGAKRPVLYPNARYEEAGPGIAQADIDECMERARAYGAGGWGEAGHAARRTATGAAVGSATGAAAGEVSGRAGRGAAAGAAGGATAGFLSWLFGSRNPDPTYQRFVEECLREKGYQPLGWR